MTDNLLNKKFEYWEHQLLDLGKRNKMINYRETKRTTIKLVEPSFNELFNRIAQNEESLTFQRPVDRETDIRVFSLLSLLENLSAPLPVTIGDIKTEGSIIERQLTLKNLRSKARLSLEEQGTNILYLSFGFIEWRDGKGSGAQWIKSPLILVPATLTLEALNSPYILKKYEDDIVLNPTLDHYMRTEYGIELPHFDGDKDTPDSYLKSLEEIADQRGWRIIREVSLGLLSFLKISMYNDLLRNEERIKRNPVIRAMAGDDSINRIPEDLYSFHPDSVSTRDCYQVMSADSSQQDAIFYSKNNISFVMQGPPGTGKSQTITNIIAEALADGKKVLFVSEKMAALQVVYRRLQEAHLGEFCLPLHSYKANKKDILEQIGANLKLKQTKVRDTAITNLEELMTLRDELNNYSSELHRINPALNLSCYEIYSKLESVQNVPSVNFVISDPLSVSQSELQSYLNIIKKYSLSINSLGYNINNNHWNGLACHAPGREYKEKMYSALEECSHAFKGLVEYINSIYEIPELIGKLTLESTSDFAEGLSLVSNLPTVPDCWLNGGDIAENLLIAEEGREQCQRICNMQNNVERVFNKRIYSFDYLNWKDKLWDIGEDLEKMRLFQGKSSEYYIKNTAELLDVFYGMNRTLAYFAETFSSINSVLGTSFEANKHNLNIISQLYAVIKDNVLLQKSWYKADLFELKELVKNGKHAAEQIKECRDRILSVWEAEILSLDYAPILTRYKTDYTNVFKIFNSQYSKDKKQIQGLSKTVLKKLPDEVAIDILNSLKYYHEQLNLFNSMDKKLSESLSSYYNRLDTKWDYVLAAITIMEKVRALPIDNYLDSILDLLSVDHKLQVSELDSFLFSAASSLSDTEKILSSYHIGINLNSANFSAASFMKVIEVFIQKLQKIEAIKADILPCLKDKDEKISNIFDSIERLKEYWVQREEFLLKADKYKERFESLYNDEFTDWEYISKLLDNFRLVSSHAFYYMLVPLINSTQERKNVYSDLHIGIKGCLKSSEASIDWLSSQFTPDSLLKDMELKELNDKIFGCLSNIDMLEKWLDYQEGKNTCQKAGLGDFIRIIEEKEFFNDVDKIFLKGFYYMWLGAICDNSDSLRAFRRNMQDDRVKRFIELDDLQLSIAQMRIREKLIENLPTEHRLLRATDEVAILNKELGKKRNIMPLRKLFRLIPNLLMRLKPCLMMSPLSVSYFLETEAYHFDLVIFDEASQIFPEDAIGAIFRGSQVIIAGDSKQLPPTSFFTSTTNNYDGDYDFQGDDDYNEIVSDSILEESAAVLPNRTLLWHYRSKHENLIAFSNREIYNNSLITFPSSIENAPDMGVEYVYVENGCYDRGGRKCNIPEAEKCVRLVNSHIQNHPNRSLGIIAFSENQQAAIENAIIDFRERNPEYEWFFDESREEPFFVKNLENVQGDERDTIIFSICYAKDSRGRMYMNFGPLGHQGGERRLNVAVTRAKCNVKLVGSILPPDIDLTRTASEGARMLRSYIEYAIKGTKALKPIENNQIFDGEDDFCEIVANFIEKRGYKIKRNIGCSDYRIDIGIVNPDNNGEYIAGIECDGLSYKKAKTARDRDHLRSAVLKSMGWNMYRVWSTEWNRNRVEEENRLLAFIESVYNHNGKCCHDMNDVKQSSVDNCIESIATETEKTPLPTSSHNPYGFPYYKEANWWDANSYNSRDDISRIKKIILYIVGIEQPIHLELLYKRMGPAFSAGKATEGVRAAIDDVILNHLKGQIDVDVEGFVRLLPLSEIIAKIPGQYETPRPIEYIHTEEIGAAMLRIVESSFGITEDDLSAECIKVFGFERKGPKLKAKTDAAIKYLVERNKIRIIDGKAQLTGE